jgi:hypothetical protein
LSGIPWTITTSEIICPANSPKTILQIITPSSHHRLKGLGWGCYFDSTSVQAQPAQVRLLRQTSVGTMTGLAPVADDTGMPETIQSSAAVNATSEPTAGNLIKRVEVHPQTGYEYLWPIGREQPIRGGEKIGIEVTAVDTVNAVGWFWAEE